MQDSNPSFIKDLYHRLPFAFRYQVRALREAKANEREVHELKKALARLNREQAVLQAFHEASQNDLMRKLRGTRKLAELAGTDALISPFPTQLEYFLGFYDLVKTTAAVPGEIVECGVGWGGTLMMLTAVLHHLKLDKRIHAYDSFEGFPEPTSPDTSPRKPQKGEWDSTSELAVGERFEWMGIQTLLRKHVTFHRGFFSETLPTGLPDEISFLHLDCDLYESYRDCLQAAYPRCQPGTVIVFDEYDDPHWPGAKTAVDEFFADTHETLEYFPALRRHGVIVKSG